ncbi:MAG: hypothetical protein AVDCRST_MAG07-3198, partial [uncultured Frankineae bacterium]
EHPHLALAERRPVLGRRDGHRRPRQRRLLHRRPRLDGPGARGAVGRLRHRGVRRADGRRHRSGAAGRPGGLDAVPRDRRRRRGGRAGDGARRQCPRPRHGRRPARAHGDPDRPLRRRLRPLAGRHDDRRRTSQRARRPGLGGPALDRPRRRPVLLRRAVRLRLRGGRDGRGRLHHLRALHRAARAGRHRRADGPARRDTQPLARLLRDRRRRRCRVGRAGRRRDGPRARVRHAVRPDGVPGRPGRRDVHGHDARPLAARAGPQRL